MSALNVDSAKYMAERFIELTKHRGVEDAAISLNVYEKAMVRIAENKISVTQYWTGAKATIYLASNGKAYVSELEVSDVKALEKILSESIELMKYLERTELYAPLPEPSGKPLRGLVDKRVVEAIKSIPDFAEALINKALSVESRLKIAGTILLLHQHRIVATSKGALLSEEKTGVEVYARAFIDEASGQWSWTGIKLSEKDLESVGEKAAEYALQATKRVKVEPGEYRAILGPLVAGNLFTLIAEMSSALMVLLGYSIFSKYEVGSKIGSKAITIIDDPHDTDLPGSTGFDDEGVATGPKPLIEEGIVRNLLHNTKTARTMNAKTTGNAGYVSPRPWNIVVRPGDMKLEEAIRDTQRGLLVTNNWYTRFQNYVEGIFSTVTRDATLYVENGEIKGGVKGLRIADTLPRLLANVVSTTRETYQVKWWEITVPTRTPYVVVENLRFTKPEGLA